jgi:hypothetical protein
MYVEQFLNLRNETDFLMVYDFFDVLLSSVF